MLSRLYRLTEAQERQITPAQAEKRFPESTVYFDHDVPGGAATFFTDGRKLYANTKGQGWWLWDRNEPGLRGDIYQIGKWVKVEKPGKQRFPKGDVVELTVEMMVGEGEDLSLPALREFAQQHSVKVVRIEASPNGYTDVTFKGHGRNIVNFFRDQGWFGDDEGILDQFMADWQSVDRDQMVRFGLTPSVVDRQLDSSTCPDCGYYGSGHYPEECPNCSPWTVDDEDEV